MRTKRIGKMLIVAGLLLIAAALFLIAYNFYEDSQAANAVSDVLEEIRTDADRENKTDVDAETSLPEQTEPELEIPDYLRDPHMEMPTKEVDGELYIGVLDIPALELSLPVINEWSYPRLKIAPCRYQGSAYLNDLIIAAHNYQSHFGTLLNLQIGDKVYFTDMDGNVFAYEVVEIETLNPTAVDSMTSGDWDLTLFTCTVGGQTRVTVRCERSE